MAEGADGGLRRRTSRALFRKAAAVSRGETLRPSALRFVLAALALLTFLSCSFDYGEQGPPPEGLPTAVFLDFSRSDIVNGRRSFGVRAKKAEYYDAERKIVLDDITFSEYDSQTGALRTEGESAHVVYHSDSGDAELSGFVKLYSSDEDAVFETDFLKYNGTQKTIEGNLDKTVMVKVGNGSWIRGAGFFADTVTRSFALRGGVEGSMVETGNSGSEQ
jgi:LPS export ABC transporter protein LptC